jgi:hypothetical protein
MQTLSATVSGFRHLAGLNPQSGASRARSGNLGRSLDFGVREEIAFVGAWA